MSTEGSSESGTLWQGRFGEGPSPELMAISLSRHFDRTMVREDIEGSRVHARGLARAGILSDDELGELLRALDQTASEFEADTFVFVDGDEDIHTAVERRVTELAGDAGAKLHTGRSRNDQVATDLRLWTTGQLEELGLEVLGLVDVLTDRAEGAGDAYLPGYTHLQHAQPVLLAHHLLAHAWALLRDSDRLGETRRRMRVSPLGAGALAGTSLPLDPATTARELDRGWEPFRNSLDAVSDRDFVADALYAVALLGVHLSRLAEELILWSTEEFGFVRLPDSHATGSSMLPQKKNPDIPELTRGKAGRLIGNLTGLLATLKGLPLAYNRDLQEDKEPLFDSVAQMKLVLAAVTGLMQKVEFDTGRMAAVADSPYAAAVDLAEYLVEHGVPFRRAHEIVGSLVRTSMEGGQSLAELVAAHDQLGAEAATLLEPGVAARRPRTAARTTDVARQITECRDLADSFRVGITGDGER